MTGSTIPPNENDLHEIIDAVMNAYLHERAVAASPPRDDGRSDDEVWTGVVTVSGAFSGTVMLSCTRGFASRAARVLFDETSLSDDDAARDLLAELTTVIGGNVKSLLSPVSQGPCHLSIPVVSIGSLEFPDAHVLTEVWSQCKADRIHVAIFQSKSDAARLSP